MQWYKTCSSALILKNAFFMVRQIVAVLQIHEDNEKYPLMTYPYPVTQAGICCYSEVLTPHSPEGTCKEFCIASLPLLPP